METLADFISSDELIKIHKQLRLQIENITSR